MFRLFSRNAIKAIIMRSYRNLPGRGTPPAIQTMVYFEQVYNSEFTRGRGHRQGPGECRKLPSWINEQTFYVSQLQKSTVIHDVL